MSVQTINPTLCARALRAPFLSVSLLPYVFGALIAPGSMQWIPFLLGFVAVAATALAANAANDEADTASGVDWQDPIGYGYFGGSKLIVKGILPSRFFRHSVYLLGAVAFVSVLLLATIRGEPGLILVLAGVILLAVSYSYPPLQLSYRGLGELTVFLLFGPVTTVGSAYLQGGDPFAEKLWILSLPMGLLAAAVLVTNEVPDATDDAAASKRTLVVRTGPQWGWILFVALAAGVYAAISWAVWQTWLSQSVLLGLLGLPLVWRIAFILKRHWLEKKRLVDASRMVIVLHTLLSLSLIAGAL